VLDDVHFGSPVGTLAGDLEGSAEICKTGSGRGFVQRSIVNTVATAPNTKIMTSVTLRS